MFQGCFLLSILLLYTAEGIQVTASPPNASFWESIRESIRDFFGINNGPNEISEAKEYSRPPLGRTRYRPWPLQTVRPIQTPTVTVNPYHPNGPGYQPLLIPVYYPDPRSGRTRYHPWPLQTVRPSQTPAGSSNHHHQNGPGYHPLLIPQYHPDLRSGRTRYHPWPLQTVPNPVRPSQIPAGSSNPHHPSGPRYHPWPLIPNDHIEPRSGRTRYHPWPLQTVPNPVRPSQTPAGSSNPHHLNGPGYHPLLIPQYYPDPRSGRTRYHPWPLQPVPNPIQPNQAPGGSNNHRRTKYHPWPLQPVPNSKGQRSGRSLFPVPPPPAPVIKLKTVHVSDKCGIPKGRGSCRMAITLYYFNSTAGKCELTSVTGCSGNGEGFTFEEECMAACHKGKQFTPATGFSNSNEDAEERHEYEDEDEDEVLYGDENELLYEDEDENKDGIDAEDTKDAADTEDSKDSADAEAATPEVPDGRIRPIESLPWDIFARPSIYDKQDIPNGRIRPLESPPWDLFGSPRLHSKQDCKDKYKSCHVNKKNCHINLIKHICPETCGECQQPHKRFWKLREDIGYEISP